MALLPVNTSFKGPAPKGDNPDVADEFSVCSSEQATHQTTTVEDEVPAENDNSDYDDYVPMYPVARVRIEPFTCDQVSPNKEDQEEEEEEDMYVDIQQLVPSRSMSLPRKPPRSTSSLSTRSRSSLTHTHLSRSPQPQSEPPLTPVRARMSPLAPSSAVEAALEKIQKASEEWQKIKGPNIHDFHTGEQKSGLAPSSAVEAALEKIQKASEEWQKIKGPNLQYLQSVDVGHPMKRAVSCPASPSLNSLKERYAPRTMFKQKR